MCMPVHHSTVCVCVCVREREREEGGGMIERLCVLVRLGMCVFVDVGSARACA